jgi:hypothetical protein
MPVNPPEYAPREAAAAGWRADDPATDAPLREALARSQAAAPALRVTADPARGLVVEGSLAEPADILLPQFAFPGWALSAAPSGAALATDPVTGLLRLALPGGRVDLAVVRTATAVQQAGWALSAASLLVWLGAGALMLRVPSPAPRGRPPPAAHP